MSILLAKLFLADKGTYIWNISNEVLVWGPGFDQLGGLWFPNRTRLLFFPRRQMPTINILENGHVTYQIKGCLVNEANLLIIYKWMWILTNKYLLNSCKTYGTYRKSTKGENIFCINREIMHLSQVNKTIEFQYVTFGKCEIYVRSISIIFVG